MDTSVSRKTQPMVLKILIYTVTVTKIICLCYFIKSTYKMRYKRKLEVMFAHRSAHFCDTLICRSSPHPTHKQPTTSMSRYKQWYRVIEKSRSEKTSADNLFLLSVDSKVLSRVLTNLGLFPAWDIPPLL